MAVVVLVLAGLLAFGLPRLSQRGRRRFWHSWIDNGMIPMFLGMLAALAIGDWPGSPERQLAMLEPIRALLALALATAGVLAGTQLRMVYLLRAGGSFLVRHSRAAVFVGLAALLPLLAVALPWRQALPPGGLVAIGGLMAALALATSQRPPASAHAFDVRHRDIVERHIAPAGWWNLLALVIVSSCFHMGLTARLPVAQAVLPGQWGEVIPGWVLVPVLSLLVGLALGWLAKGASNRSEAALFLLSVLGLAAGLALLLETSPLFTGLLVGGCFVNVALGRLGMIERLLIDLEQPVVTATGFLVGLLVIFDAVGRPAMLGSGPWLLPDLMIVAVLLLRIVSRSRLSPSHGSLSTRVERACAAPGAVGILLLAVTVLAPAPMPGLAVPLIWALVVLKGLNEWLEWRLYLRVRSDPTGTF